MPSASTPSPQPILSVAMIVRDAGDLLAETIQSIAELADEIVVVDTGSADATVEIAEAHGAKVSQLAWQDNFSAARNHTLQIVSGQWVLWLDAGETVDPSVVQPLRKLLAAQLNPQHAYALLLETPSAGPHQNLSAEHAARVRLVPRRADLYFEGRVRERIEPSIQAAGMSVEQLPYVIRRSEQENESPLREDRAHQSLHIAELEIADRGDQPNALIAMGEALSTLHRYHEAADVFRRAISQCPQANTDRLESYYGLLAALENSPQESETQIAVCLEALDSFPLDAQLLCAMGAYMLKQKRLDLAERSYRIAAEHGQIDPASWHVVDIDDVAAVCLSLTLELQGKIYEARKSIDEAQGRNPSSVKLQRKQIDLCVKLGQDEDALAAYHRLPEDTPHREALGNAVRGAVLAARRNWLEAEPYLYAAYSDGCLDPLCLRWLAITYLSQGNHQAAEPILHQWRDVEPYSAEVVSYLAAVQRPSIDRDLTGATSPQPQAGIDPPAQPAVPPADAIQIRIDSAAPNLAADHRNSAPSGTLPGGNPVEPGRPQ